MGRKPNHLGKGKTPINQVNKGELKYFFCKKGCVKKDCLKCQKWHKKKGNLNLISIVSFEANMCHLSNNILFTDSSSIIHTCNNMQGLVTQKRLAEVNSTSNTIACEGHWDLSTHSIFKTCFKTRENILYSFIF